MSSAKKIAIKNVGPIRDLEINMPEPGVYALTGDHGTGKSTALAAVARALGDDEVHVALRDGANKGSVILDDVTLLAVGKIDRRTGKASVTLASTSPLATLVDPGIKDPVSARRAEIQSLLKLVDLPVTENAISTLIQNNGEALAYLEEHEGIQNLCDRDIVTAADKVRRLTHDLKGEYKDTFTRAQGEMTASAPQKPEIVVDVTIADADAIYREAVGNERETKGSADQRAAREAERAEIQETLGDRPDVVLAEATEQAAMRDHDALADEIDKQEAELAIKKERIKHLSDTVDDAIDASNAARKAQGFWDRRKAILDAEITGATRAAVERATRAVSGAKTELEYARESAAYRERLAKYDDATRRYNEASAKFLEIEVIALNVTGQLGKLLSQSGIDNATVEDGVLMFKHPDGTLEPFHRLSFGEKLGFGLGPFTQRNADCILSLPFNFWAGLNKPKQQEAIRLIVKCGIRALTEIAGEGTLRVERLPHSRQRDCPACLNKGGPCVTCGGCGKVRSEEEKI